MFDRRHSGGPNLDAPPSLKTLISGRLNGFLDLDGCELAETHYAEGTNYDDAIFCDERVVARHLSLYGGPRGDLFMSGPGFHPGSTPEEGDFASYSNGDTLGCDVGILHFDTTVSKRDLAWRVPHCQPTRRL